MKTKSIIQSVNQLDVILIEYDLCKSLRGSLLSIHKIFCDELEHRMKQDKEIDLSSLKYSRQKFIEAKQIWEKQKGKKETKYGKM